MSDCTAQCASQAPVEPMIGSFECLDALKSDTKWSSLWLI